MVIKVPTDVSDDKAVKILDALVNVGLADAANNAQNGCGDNDAEIAAKIKFHYPTIIS